MAKKKQTSTKTTSRKKPRRFTVNKPVGLDPLVLEEALYKAEFDFDKALCKFMVLGKSLETMKEGAINGTKVELGVLERRLTKEVRGWFKEWGWKIGNKMTINHHDVPIEVKIIKEVVDPYKNPDVMFYKVTQFEIPNPWRLAL